MHQIIFYKDRNGNEPVKEYINQLESKASASKDDRIKYKKILEYLQYLSHYGARIGEPIICFTPSLRKKDAKGADA